ncbi:hypothetical protein CAPTEDRAFT_215694 [Capitella teleta]|uniref:EGF-like domain-containing protein n=1 Tax=Capitella teleta TaxID=283909 RepID=R7TJN2_CAPTE|nr:hypothetical protein CAPTEDRAFT_215694 [Capitella teleta]|eukprot:ELT93909.1 hypothetical protein CAPTEDRAFT_215694 [Capitella teleta]
MYEGSQCGETDFRLLWPKLGHRESLCKDQSYCLNGGTCFDGGELKQFCECPNGKKGDRCQETDFENVGRNPKINRPTLVIKWTQDQGIPESHAKDYGYTFAYTDESGDVLFGPSVAHDPQTETQNLTVSGGSKFNIYIRPYRLVDGVKKYGWPSETRSMHTSSACEEGSFGVNCTGHCTGCKEHKCSAVDGRCSDGCHLWFTGEFCTEEPGFNLKIVITGVLSLQDLSLSTDQVNWSTMDITWTQDPEIPPENEKYHGSTYTKNDWILSVCGLFIVVILVILVIVVILVIRVHRQIIANERMLRSMKAGKDVIQDPNMNFSVQEPDLEMGLISQP